MAASSASFGSRASCRRVDTVVRGKGERLTSAGCAAFHTLSRTSVGDPRPVCLIRPAAGCRGSATVVVVVVPVVVGFDSVASLSLGRSLGLRSRLSCQTELLPAVSVEPLQCPSRSTPMRRGGCRLGRARLLSRRCATGACSASRSAGGRVRGRLCTQVRAYIYVTCVRRAYVFRCARARTSQLITRGSVVTASRRSWAPCSRTSSSSFADSSCNRFETRFLPARLRSIAFDTASRLCGRHFACVRGWLVDRVWLADEWMRACVRTCERCAGASSSESRVCDCRVVVTHPRETW